MNSTLYQQSKGNLVCWLLLEHMYCKEATLNTALPEAEEWFYAG